jgi:transposase
LVTGLRGDARPTLPNKSTTSAEGDNNKIDSEVPADLEVHLISDNYGTHKHPIIKTWVRNHPRFHLQFTPTYSSWLNLVERFFGYVTADLLQRSDHHSVQTLEADIRKWAQGMERRPQTIRVDQDRPTDPRITRTTYPANLKFMALAPAGASSHSVSRTGKQETDQASNSSTKAWSTSLRVEAGAHRSVSMRQRLPARYGGLHDVACR